MKIKTSISFLFLLFLSSCSINQSQLVHNPDPKPVDLTKPNPKLDFTKGKWLLGNINVTSDMKEELTQLVMKDFKEYLGERLKNAVGKNSLLLGNNTTLQPDEKQLKQLQIGTGFDFFINIRCTNGVTDLSDFNWTEHSYFKSKDSYAKLTLEIYDLNLHQIVYSQAAKLTVEKRSLIGGGNQTEYVIRSCYKKIFQDIKRELRNDN